MLTRIDKVLDAMKFQHEPKEPLKLSAEPLFPDIPFCLSDKILDFYKKERQEQKERQIQYAVKMLDAGYVRVTQASLDPGSRDFVGWAKPMRSPQQALKSKQDEESDHA